ncbi:hypothetical protein AB0383_05570 [Amycolatopsis sp. NPDC051373]|uniref:WXG100-like domain-containing protein n=1 Tax=Amycolatopsis sp. NPDC051373 TaxID=3155801 RepID=UPI00344FCF2C
MAIAEPDNEPWAAVKQLADEWPPDDEDDVTELAANWRGAGNRRAQAGTEPADQRQAPERAWRDEAGGAMGRSVAAHAVTLRNSSRAPEQQAQLADRYARTLKEVKTAIAQTIAVNPTLHLQLANPAYGAAGKARQQQLVTQAAQALVAGKTQGRHAPAQAPDTDTLLGKVGDVAGMVATVAGGPALIPGVGVAALPVAVLAGATALAAHAIDMIGTDSYDNPTSDSAPAATRSASSPAPGGSARPPPAPRKPRGRSTRSVRASTPPPRFRPAPTCSPTTISSTRPRTARVASASRRRFSRRRGTRTAEPAVTQDTATGRRFSRRRAVLMRTEFPHHPGVSDVFPDRRRHRSRPWVRARDRRRARGRRHARRRDRAQ